MSNSSRVGCRAAAAALRQRLAAVVALADHLHLRRRGLAPRRPRRCIIASSSFQLGLGASSSSPSSTAASATSLPAGGGLPSGACARRRCTCALLAHAVDRAVRRDRDLQLVRAPADVDLGDAELEGGLPEVDQRGGLHAADAAAHGEHRDEHVGRVAASTGTSITGLVAGQRHDERVEHAFALDRDQRRRLAERHAHLQARGLAGLVAPLLGQQVHAVAVAATSNHQSLVAGDPDARGAPATRGPRRRVTVACRTSCRSAGGLPSQSSRPLGVGAPAAERRRGA